MGSWNTRVVRLQKQLNHWGKALAGKGSTKAQQTQAVAAAIARYRTAFKPGSKAVAFWRTSFTFRDGKFFDTYTTKGRKNQAPMGVTGAGYPTIRRQDINLKRGLKVSPSGSKDKRQARLKPIVNYRSKTKTLVASTEIATAKALLKGQMGSINSALRGDGFRAYRVDTSRHRKASDNTRKGNETRAAKKAARMAELKAIKPNPTKRKSGKKKPKK